MVSYADLVTLLLALFTTLYASSTVDQKKMTPVVDSIQEAFKNPPVTQVHPTASIVPPVAVVPHPASKEDIMLRLSRELQDALAQKRVELLRDARGVVVSFPDDATFPTGNADATAEALRVIARVGDTLRTIPNAIRIEGHTDDVPIRTARFQSNWELSTARAAAVVAFLAKTVGIQADRLSAAGYGEFHPRVPNDSPSNRARNRRVDLVILGAVDPLETDVPVEQNVRTATDASSRPNGTNGAADARP
jgi:chemotaxis protein MotB